MGALQDKMHQVPPEQISDEQATPEQTQQVPPEQTRAEQANPMHDTFGTSSEEEEEEDRVRRTGVNSSSQPTTCSLLFLSFTLFSIITLNFA
jgi:CO dehydrogenase/acetyl-CoA synthase beta subunit